MRNPDDTRADDVEKFLADEAAMEDRKQVLIAELLKQKEAAIKAFDARLAKLGYRPNDKPKRSHHRRQTGSDDSGGTSAKPKPSA